MGSRKGKEKKAKKRRETKIERAIICGAKVEEELLQIFQQLKCIWIYCI